MYAICNSPADIQASCQNCYLYKARTVPAQSLQVTIIDILLSLCVLCRAAWTECVHTWHRGNTLSSAERLSDLVFLSFWNGSITQQPWATFWLLLRIFQDKAFPCHNERDFFISRCLLDELIQHMYLTIQIYSVVGTNVLILTCFFWCS